RLAGEIAHDFNNVLAAIIGYARLVERKADDVEAVRKNAAGIRAASDRATTLIGQLLQFSRRRAGGPEPVDVAVATEQMHDMLSHLVGENIRVRLQVGRPVPTVLLPRGQIEQVLLNLVVNARDAMPEGGTVSVTVRAPEPGWVEIAVADEGSGMDQATIERLFEPFFTTKPEGRGTGLGLPTVHAIVTKAGGRVEVVSAPGEGSVFRVLLPTHVPRPAPETPSSPRVEGPVRGRHVLLVEDEAPLRGILAEALEEAGYRVTTAGNADEALAAAGKDPMDVVVSDIVLPGMSGFELAGRLHAMFPRVRFVYMSGFAGSAPSPPDRPPGPLLHKPFSPQLLAKAVGIVCGEVRVEKV
ncbi:MAG: ATP-binding protein, partial [Myxococcota bacterium]